MFIIYVDNIIKRWREGRHGGIGPRTNDNVNHGIYYRGLLGSDTV
jgi:hypothetical protein